MRNYDRPNHRKSKMEFSFPRGTTTVIEKKFTPLSSLVRLAKLDLVTVVTDDVSIVELMGKPVKLTVGDYTNLKLTTPEDMIIAETILKDRGFS